MNVFVIIPAAGLGTRMMTLKGGNNATAKQFTAVGGEPILRQTIRRFLASSQVKEIVVALRNSEAGRLQSWILEEKLNSRVRTIEGGDHRQRSVYNALRSLEAAKDDIVLVHDAVRPFVMLETINKVIVAVEKHGAAIAGLPAIDTVKQVERTAGGAVVTSTIPRERIVLAQTPQGFHYGLLREAFDDAGAIDFLGTDESSLVERIGHSVHVVMGSPENFKITTPADLQLAEFYAQQRTGLP